MNEFVIRGTTKRLKASFQLPDSDEVKLMHNLEQRSALPQISAEVPEFLVLHPGGCRRFRGGPV